jgi:DNA-binding FadR family transcriptional regulator
MQHDSREGASNQLEWTPIGGNRASERVVEQIRKSFFAGMQPGDWIGTESSLAALFGVSRLTMRDAVRKLETCGMVEVKVGVGGGLRVAHAAPERFAEALAVQIHLSGMTHEEIAEAASGLDPLLARLAAKRRSEDHLRQLAKLVEEHRAVRHIPYEFNRSTSHFHVVIAEASGNRVLSNVVRALSATQQSWYVVDDQYEAHASATVEAHEEILAAITARDADRSCALMEAHERATGQGAVSPAE